MQAGARPGGRYTSPLLQMAKLSNVSAGLLLFRRPKGGLEVFLAHPGGPFWKMRDLGAQRNPHFPQRRISQPQDPVYRQAPTSLWSVLLHFATVGVQQPLVDLLICQVAAAQRRPAAGVLLSVAGALLIWEFLGVR